MKTTALTRAAVPIVGVAALLAGCTAAPPEVDPSGTLRAALGDVPESWAVGQDLDMGFYRVPYENLLTLDETGTPVPWLATDWEITNEAMTINLRTDVTFHDGEPFNAEAVKANIEAVRDTPSAFSGQLQTVESVDVVDDDTVTLNLSQPTPSLPTTLASRPVPMISPAAIAAELTTEPVGTGPWAYDAAASIPGSLMVFTATEDYWGTSPYFETIELHGIGEDVAKIAAMVAGEIDVIDFDYETFPIFDAESNFERFSYPSIRNGLVFLDRGPGGVFEDINVRKAWCSALNREEFIAATGDPDYEVTTQHFLEGQPGYNPDVKGYPFDLEAANGFLAAAGNPTVEGTAIMASFMQDRADIFGQQISQLPGQTFATQVAPPPQYDSEWLSGQYSIAAGSHDALAPYDWYATWWAADGGGNPFGAESAEMKAAADAAIAAGDSEEANALWAEVTRIVNDEALFCGNMRAGEVIGFNTDTVAEVAPPVVPFEGQSIDWRTVRPVAAAE